MVQSSRKFRFRENFEHCRWHETAEQSSMSKVLKRLILHNDNSEISWKNYWSDQIINKSPGNRASVIKYPKTFRTIHQVDSQIDLKQKKNTRAPFSKSTQDFETLICVRESSTLDILSENHVWPDCIKSTISNSARSRSARRSAGCSAALRPSGDVTRACARST